MMNVESIDEFFEHYLPDTIGYCGVENPRTDLALPLEHQATGSMVAKRREEFLTGRTCARAVLRRLGVPDQPVLRRENRAPLWPEGVVGSITHTEGFCAAAVANACDVFSLGIDVERGRGVSRELFDYVATRSEQERFQGLEDWATILFSIKESVFKCLNPPTGVWLEFHDVEVLELADGSYRARVPKIADGVEFEGAFGRTGKFVGSVLILENSGLLGRSASDV